MHDALRAGYRHAPMATPERMATATVNMDALPAASADHAAKMRVNAIVRQIPVTIPTPTLPRID